QCQVNALSHITGGGLLENIPRVLPAHTVAAIDSNTWVLPSVFQWLQAAGNIETQELYRTFNCGIGMVICLPEDQVTAATQLLQAQGETVFVLGTIESGHDATPKVAIR